jgi:SAM-dependent methyltransferase
MVGPSATFGTLETVISPGTGLCVDVGCGDGRHRIAIERQGYRWVGLDLRPYRQESIQGNALHLPICNEACDAVLSWQALEHFPRPWVAVQEVQRILKPGGLLVGSTSFLEPFHDSSYFGFSALGLRQLLSDGGFTSISIVPGISAFPLMSWTLFSRLANGRLASFALAISGQILQLANRIYPLVNRAYFKISGQAAPRLEDSYWASQMPLDFAGHLAFRAYKKG